MAEPRIEETEVDFTPCTDIAFKQLKNSVELTLSDRLPDEIAANANIFVLSNTYGYFVAGQNEGFLIDKLSSLRSAFENGEVSAPNKYDEAARVEISGETISHIRLSADELTVIVGLRGGLIYLYSVTKLLSKTKGAKPMALLDLGCEISDIRPNPAADRNGLLAVMLDNRTIKMINMDGTITATLDKHKYTAMAWSSKGKQIMCGTENGRLYQIDPEGVLKKEHLPTPDNDVTTISWLETAVFIVVYNEQPEEDGTPSFVSDFCVISKEDKTKPTKFTRYRDNLCFPIPNDICGTNYYISTSLKTLSKSYKEFMVVGFSASTDITTIARSQDGEWMMLDLPEVDRPMVTGSEPCMMGMAIDLTATKPLEPLEEEGPEVPAAPVLYIYNNLGQLSAYSILELPVAKKGLASGSMVQPKALPQAASVTKVTPAAKATLGPKTTTVSKAASVTPSMAKVAVSPATPSAEVKASPAFSFGAAVAASAKPGFSPAAGFKTGAPATGPSAFAAPTPKVSFGATTSAFGSASPSPREASRSFAPNPVVTPNPAFQQNTTAPPKPPGTMQKILQENEPPLRVVRKKSVADAPSAPAPKVSAAMDALSRQLENTYLAMTEELKTLHSHVRETEELVKAREHVFGELDQFMLVTEKRIKAAEKTKVLAESVSKDFTNLQTDLVKVMTKRDEIGKLLEARKDPTLLEKVLSSELSPAQASMQDRMTQTIETIDSRLRDLEKHVESMNSEANKLRHGQFAEHPTLDSIRRSIRHISTALISRQSELDRLSNDLDNLAITESISPQHGSTLNVSAKGSIAAQNKDSIHPRSFASVPGPQPSEQSKAALARELRRVFTANSRFTAILNAPGSTVSGAPLSVLPKLKEVEFVPAFEPRRSERKRRLAAAAASQPEAPSTATTPSSLTMPAPAATPVQSSDQVGPALGSSSAPTLGATGTTTVVSTLSPAFGFQTAVSPVPAPAFGAPQTSSPFSSAPMSAKAAPTFGTPSMPSFSTMPAAAASMSFGTSKAPAFSGFQVPKSEPSAAPAFSVAPSLPTTPSFSAAPISQPAWSFSNTSTPPQSAGFAGFQVPSSVGTGARVTPAPAPAFSFAKPVLEKEPEVDLNAQKDEDEDEEEEVDEDEEQDEAQYDDEGEYEDEEEGHYHQARYEHDGQVYELEDDGSEPETWGSDTDQRDFDQGEEGEEENEGEEGQYEEEDDEQSEGEGATTPALASSEKKDPSAKTAWAAPGFSFPATASAASTTAAVDSTNPAFLFFTAAANKPKESDVKAAPITQSAFGTTPGGNTFGSTATFAFGAPQAAASKPAPVSAFGQKPSIPTAREPVKAEESDDEEEDLPDEEHRDLPDEEQESDVDDDQDEEQEALGSEVEEEGEFDEDGSEVEEEENDADEDSDKESALTAVQMKSSFAPSTASNAKSSNLESSGLDFSKVGFGGSAQKGGEIASPFAKSASSTPNTSHFGAAPAFGSASDVKATSERSLDMPFVKLPRTRRESRDSLDSNTTDDEDQAVPTGSEPSSPVLGFGKASKGTSGGLDSFNLSLGSEQAKTDKKPAWGESSFSSWASASQSSVAPQSAWDAGSTLGSSQSASSASPFAAVPTSGPGASSSPFAAAATAPSALTSTPASSATTTTTPAAWGTTGGFGQASTLGSGFGSNATGFGQTSQAPATTGSVFGQTSQSGSATGFGQTSALGSSTGFGQVSTPATGAGFGQTSTIGSGFGQSSIPGAGSTFGQTSTAGSATGFGQTSTLGAGTGFGQASQLGAGSAFGQTAQIGGGTAFGQTSQMGSGFGQTAFGQPSQIAGGAFGKPAASGFASASTQSNFGAFASSGTNAFAAASQSSVNVLDQSSGGNVFGAGGGFGDSSTSKFGSGGGGGAFGGGTGFGGASTAFAGANNAFGAAGNNAGGFGGGGGFGASTGQSAFGTAAGQGTSVFGQPQQGQANTGFGSNQTNTGFGSSQANINPNKPSFSGFR
ncbi:hypothetical protein BGZ96_000007 [Linnemannia gamsii]|uniref:Nucleoporin Nup159/Nup146 N-terminal domain-containing protein n=1 Tax=Linnemannia gamsii TaxID=64522 RepID=A0ABQ7KGI9_9FUNG|nr:hypothetical protein BGZ96_000007 [Linnemannia gamsii]